MFHFQLEMNNIVSGCIHFSNHDTNKKTPTYIWRCAFRAEQLNIFGVHSVCNSHIVIYFLYRFLSCFTSLFIHFIYFSRLLMKRLVTYIYIMSVYIYYTYTLIIWILCCLYPLVIWIPFVILFGFFEIIVSNFIASTESSKSALAFCF